MANNLTFQLELVDVKGQPIEDKAVQVRFFKISGQQIGADHFVQYSKKSPKLSFSLTGFPENFAIKYEAFPSNYRQIEGIIPTMQGDISRKVVLAVKPDKWSAEFMKWNDLSENFFSLKSVLDKSDNIFLIETKQNLGKLIDDGYNSLAEAEAVLAKASLLNLYAKMMLLQVPDQEVNWFSFVEEILQIGRERFIAIVKPTMWQAIDKAIRNSEFYEKANASNHKGNIPSGYKIDEIVSTKTDEENGNLQMTVAKTTTKSNQNVTILDADIDENARLLLHFFDLIKHAFNGGTHPYDIHEYMLLKHQGLDLGYKLVMPL
ncbi:MAG: hypothetical protein JNN15_11480 [Blastocatellia bacterium]|nr:hypothetical protein [Blastocatellia bacterium]